MVMALQLYRFSVTSRWFLLALIVSFAACNKSDKPQLRVFASPDEAGNALLQAAKSGDSNALVTIFGPGSKDIISSGDAVQDKAVVDAFVAAYGVMHRWRKMPDDAQDLLVGAENFAFPIPLKKNAGGQWFFDTAAGKDEILARRIGRNELAVLDTCVALADAQVEYFSLPHDSDGTQQYAPKFISDKGKQNGLYWESAGDQPKSPLGPLVAFATTEGYSAKANANAPFHGYLFRMLKGQGGHAPGGTKDYTVDGKMVGGFAFVAYPAEYGNSGVMTFIINQDGILLQKDLGKTTADTVIAMSQFDPDSSWSPVGDWGVPGNDEDNSTAASSVSGSPSESGRAEPR
jgi:hypothetical protein